MKSKVTRSLRRLVSTSFAASALVALFSAAIPASAQQSGDTRVTLATRTAASLAAATDAGPLPAAQRLSLTLTLAPSADRTAALQQYLADLTTPNSGSYHKWLTPQQFAASYGASSDQLATATTWAQSQGLSVDAVSPSNLRLTVSGTTTQLQSAFAVSLHAYTVAGAQYFASTTLPSLPASTASVIAAVDGMDNLPANSALILNTAPATLSSIASVVDANTTPILTLTSALCTANLSTGQLAEYTTLLRQASAQGITTISSRDCPSGSFPAALSEVTAVSAPGAVADTTAPIAARPSWQNAPGLPADSLRYAPDLTSASLTSFAQTIAALQQKSGSRLGNINQTLYALLPTPGLYTQPDAAKDTWEPATGLGLIDLQKLAQAFPLGTAGVTLNYYSSNGAPIHGQTFTLTTTLISSTGGATPTGSITYAANSAVFTSATVNLDGNATATSAPYQLPGGTYAITATYSGDANYAANSATINLTVSPEAAAYTITSPATATLGDTITTTVTLKSNSGFGTPVATATITPFGLTNVNPVNVGINGSNGTATGSTTFTLNAAGTITFKVNCFPSDQNFTCDGTQQTTTQVAHVTPVVTLTLNPSVLTTGTPTTLNAVVATTGGIAPTGNVQFFDNGTQLGTGNAPNATLPNITLAPGTVHSLYATYVGDDNYNLANSNTVTPTVSSVATTTNVTVNPTAPVFGQALMLNVTVVPTAVINGTQPTGTLTIAGAGTTFTAPVTGGTATVKLPALPIGNYTVTTAYGGDTVYAASTGNPVTFTVGATVGALMTDLQPPSFTTNSTSTLTVTVTLPNNGQLPAGSTFQASILTIGSAVSTGIFTINNGGNTGTGQVIIPAPIAGSYTLQITCPNNASFTCTAANIAITSTSTSGPAPSKGLATTTTLAAVPNPPVAGQSVALTATVQAPTLGSTAISGTVTFYDGLTPLSGAVIVTVANNIATATTNATLSTSPNHTLTAIYSGDTVYATSTSNGIVLGTGSGTTSTAAITLKSNVTTGTAGLDVVLTASVTGLTTAGASPTGTVTFYLAGTTPTALGTATLTASGAGVAIATYSSTNFPVGNSTVYAVYNGDGNFASVTSNNITIGLTDYSVTFVSPTTLTLTQGQSGTVSLLLTDIGGYTGTVAFGCMPPVGTGITCSFNPTTLTTGGSTTTLTVTTTAPIRAANTTPGIFARNLAGTASLAALLCLLLPGRKRRRLPTVLLVLLALGITANLGCGNGVAATNGANGGTPFGTSILTINTAGSDGTNTIHHNYTYQVTVQ
ncbi:Ig-like domain repeat protein [Granulicella tundricola]|nr:Ig-like domain repeat protein [Granulicella tundricola]